MKRRMGNFYWLFVVVALLQITRLAKTADTEETETSSSIDHVRVVVVVDNSTTSSPLWRETSTHLEAAAKFFTFYDRALIANQTRYMVSVLKIPIFDDPLVATNMLCKRIQKETNLIGMVLTDSSSTFRSFIGEISQLTAIPVIELFSLSSMTMLPVPSHFHFYMCDSMIPVVQEVISAYRWINMLLLYDTPHNLACVNQLLGNPRQIGHALALGVSDDNFYEVVHIIKTKWTSVVVAFETEMTLRFLHLALRMGILNPDFAFIFTNPDVHLASMEEFAHNQPNLTFFRFISKSNFTNEIIDVARQFDELQPKYKILAPITPSREGIQNILLYDQDLQLPLPSAMLFDLLLLIRSTVEHLLIGSNLPIWLPSDNTVNCGYPATTPQGRVLTASLLEETVDGLTGQVQFNRTTRIRDTFCVEILGLGTIGLRRIGAYWTEAVHEGIPGMLHQLHLERDIPSLLQLSAINVRGNRTSKEAKEKKVVLKVVTLLEKPYVMIQRDPAKSNKKHQIRTRATEDHSFEGYCIDLLEEIAQLADFYYSIHLVRDGKYGSYNASSGRWSGMIGEIVEGVASLAVAPLTITYAREQAVDFTKPFINLGISILYVEPFKTSPSMFSFMQPLAMEVWFAVSVAFVTVTVVFYVLGHFIDCAHLGTPEPSIDDPPPTEKKRDRQTKIFSFLNSFFFTTGSFVKMGAGVVPTTIPVRIISCAWWFFAMIIIASYTANLAAFLTVETLVSPFENAEELAQQTNVFYGAVKGGATENFFRESKIETYQKMWNFMKDKDVFTRNNSEGIERVRNSEGGYAYLMESVSMDYIVANDNEGCKLRQVGGLLDSKGYGLAMSKDSPFRDSLSMAILQLQENDKLQLLYNKWWKYSGKSCTKNEDNKAKVLDIPNVLGVFLILFVGLGFSTFTLIVELIWYHHTKRDPNDKRSYLQWLVDSVRMAFLNSTKRRIMMLKRFEEANGYVDESEIWHVKHVKQSQRVARRHAARKKDQRQQQQQQQQQLNDPLFANSNNLPHHRSSSLTLRNRPVASLVRSNSGQGSLLQVEGGGSPPPWQRSHSFKEIAV